ncbi:MAG: YceI family protein [Saprospiraceae bacterium]|nr:YceI family protein [Saprospiraceae bacterium]
MPKYITLIFLIFSLSIYAQQKVDEELLIFINTKTDSEFTKSDINKLKEEMHKNNIPSKIIDVNEKGAPIDIGYTPCIVYRNYLGKKLYKGRHTSHKRILNFIRTVRRLEQSSISYKEKNIIVWKKERANLFFKLKITSPEGVLPDDFDQKQFDKMMIKGIKQGFNEAHYCKSHLVGNSDDIFFCNFYPYFSKDGNVYVSTEIFSHYDCINPIYQQFDFPSKSNSIMAAFDSAASNTFSEIKIQIVNSKKGDAINYIDKNIKVINWNDLDLNKLEAPKKNIQTEIKNIAFPIKWDLSGPVDESTPILTFHFPPPLRNYGGELKKTSGNITLNNNHSLEDAAGTFVVDVNSLEMGVTSLNNAVKETMLIVKKYPTATLVFRKIYSDDLKLAIGKITHADIEADLTIVHKTGQVIAKSQFEPFLNEQGDLMLLVSSQFVAEDLTGSYQISGPDGPSTSNNKMFFNANFIMKVAP